MNQTIPPASDQFDVDAEPGWSMAVHEPTAGPTRTFDILFLHGMASGGWIWKDDFLAQFRRAGYRVWTLNLPGRRAGPTPRKDPDALTRAANAAMGASTATEAASLLAGILPGANLFDGPSLDDFTTSLDQAVAAIDRPVAIVCHSLGGAVAQNHIRRQGRPHGLALVCSVPPYGMWRASTHWAFATPDLWKAFASFSLFGLANSDAQVMRRNLFPNGVSDGDFGQFVAHLRDESFAATLSTSGFPPFAPMPGRRDNVLVLGTAKDRMVPEVDVWMTGAWYGTKPVILPDAGHMPMLESGREALADTLVNWTDTL